MCFTCEHLWHVVPALIVILGTPLERSGRVFDRSKAVWAETIRVIWGKTVMKAGPHQHHHFNFDDGFLFGDWGAVDQIKNDNAEQYCCADDSPTSDACEQMMFA